MTTVNSFGLSLKNIYIPLLVGKQAIASTYNVKNGPVKPGFLTITSFTDSNVYDISFGSMGDNIHLTNTGIVTLSYTTGLSVAITTTTPLVISVTLGLLQFENLLNYNNGDNYIIYLEDMIDGQQALSVIANRPKASQFIGAGGGFELLPITSPTTIQVPIIQINGQTTLNGDYLSDMTFEIQDKYKYKCHKNIITKCHCEPHYLSVDKLKTTTFYKNNIPLQCVVKGKGSLSDKINAIVNDIGEPNYDLFLQRFILYGMLKYILIRLIYGEFDLSKMCRNFNKQFFKDLNHTRFCGFIDFFENPVNGIVGIDRFYIKCIKND